MKIIAYTALLYGSDYLGYAIRSIIDHVDEYWVIYTPIGSHGSRADVPCPDSEEALYAIATEAAGDKLWWYKSTWSSEGQQRDKIHELVPDADVVIVLDADEIWPQKTIAKVIEYAGTIQYSAPYRTIALPMIHYWRSFYHCIIDDKSYPARVIFPRIDASYGGTTYHGLAPINHFGYAQNAIVTAYKQYTHGHAHEWRHDIDWYKDRFLANAQADCHPVVKDYWKPVSIDPWAYLPDFMSKHPYAHLGVIK